MIIHFSLCSSVTCTCPKRPVRCSCQDSLSGSLLSPLQSTQTQRTGEGPRTHTDKAAVRVRPAFSAIVAHTHNLEIYANASQKITLDQTFAEFWDMRLPKLEIGCNFLASICEISRWVFQLLRPLSAHLVVRPFQEWAQSTLRTELHKTQCGELHPQLRPCWLQLHEKPRGSKHYVLCWQLCARSTGLQTEYTSKH